MLHITPAEDDEAGLKFFLVYDEAHVIPLHCAESVQIGAVSH
jgi:hypothetical protein